MAPILLRQSSMERATALLQLSFRIDANRRHEFRQHADLVLRDELPDGCLERALFVKMGEVGVFLWVERWASAESLAQHTRSTHHRALVGAIRVLGRLDSEHVVALEEPE